MANYFKLTTVKNADGTFLLNSVPCTANDAGAHLSLLKGRK